MIKKAYSKCVIIVFLLAIIIGCSKNRTKENKKNELIKTPECFQLWNEGNDKTEEEMEIIRRNLNTPPDKTILDNKLPNDKLVKKGLEAARKYCYPADEVKSWEVLQTGKYCRIEFYMEEPKEEYIGGNGFYVTLDCISGDLVYIHILQ